MKSPEDHMHRSPRGEAEGLSHGSAARLVYEEGETPALGEDNRRGFTLVELAKIIREPLHLLHGGIRLDRYPALLDGLLDDVGVRVSLPEALLDDLGVDLPRDDDALVLILQ
jgi:hypothetical protein